MGKTSDADQLQAQLDETQRNFEAFRRRSREDAEKARARGRDETAGELLDLVDDFDRAIKAMQDAGASEDVVSGVRSLRARVLRRFDALGYEPFASEGDSFDPAHHEAVSVEPGVGPDGSLLRVHRRGWSHSGEVVRPAMVTVLQGSRAPDPEPEETPRRPRRPDAHGYVCPYGISGCNADCPGCAPPPEAFLSDETESEFATARAFAETEVEL